MSALELCKSGLLHKHDPSQLETLSDKREQGTQTEQSQPAGPPQASRGTVLWPILTCQSPRREYNREGLGFRPLHFRYRDLPAIPHLQTFILFLVGILASRDLTIMTPLCHLLLEVS